MPGLRCAKSKSALFSPSHESEPSARTPLGKPERLQLQMTIKERKCGDKAEIDKPKLSSKHSSPSRLQFNAKIAPNVKSNIYSQLRTHNQPGVGKNIHFRGIVFPLAGSRNRVGVDPQGSCARWPAAVPPRRRPLGPPPSTICGSLIRSGLTVTEAISRYAERLWNTAPGSSWPPGLQPLVSL